VFERRGDESLRGLACFFGLLFITEVGLILVFGVDYRFVDAVYVGNHAPFRADRPCRCACWCPSSARWRCSPACSSSCRAASSAGAIMAVSQDRLALQLMSADPARIKRIAFAPLDRHGGYPRRLPHHHPAGRAVDRPRTISAASSPSASWADSASFPGMLTAAMLLGVVESIITRRFYGPSWSPAVRLRLPAAHAGLPALRHHGAIGDADGTITFLDRRLCRGAAVVVFGLSLLVKNQYYFFAGYVRAAIHRAGDGVGNILGGLYPGYVNFGTRGVLRAGAYSTSCSTSSSPMPIPALDPGRRGGRLRRRRVRHGLSHIPAAAVVFFSIATLALAVVVQTFHHPTGTTSAARRGATSSGRKVPVLGNYIEYLWSWILMGAWGLLVREPVGNDRERSMKERSRSREDEARLERKKIEGAKLNDGIGGTSASTL